jgi:chloramphenicol-sensitive protein RarD
LTLSPKWTEPQKGLAYAVAAHTLWAVMIIYLKLLSHVPAVETAVHRGLWAFPVAALILWWTGAGAEGRAVLRDSKKMRALTFSAGLIAFNWALYIWAIDHDRVVESALGYYINPLMNVLMGLWFLRERLSRLKVIALVIAAVGVVVQTVVAGVFPWVGLILAATFCLYGFLRKQMAVTAVTGFFIETLILLVPTSLYVLFGWMSGTGVFMRNMPETYLLLGLGPFTALPLLLYAAAVRRIWYSTAGIIQYSTPSLAVALAVFIYHEPMSMARLASLAIIWLAIVIFSIASLMEEKVRRSIMKST